MNYILKCKNCQNYFETSRKGVKFCSPNCASKYNGNKLYLKTCICCEREFEGKRVQKYCSEICELEWNSEIRICVSCGNKFKCQKRFKTRFCSSECVAEFNAKERKTCQHCGKRFGSFRKNSKFCSRTCFIEYTNRNEVIGEKIYSGRYSDTSSIKRAKRFGVKWEVIDVNKIFERDNWTCKICNKEVSRDKAHPHPLSISLDHIVPLSKGGTHTKDNVQTSHLGCNIHKSDSLKNAN